MPRFDWERWLRSRHIDYAPTSARQIAISCPFCGPDHSLHRVSINLDGRGWRCWRRPATYYGRSPVPLVQKLLGCTAEEARQIVGGDKPPPPPTADVLAENSARLARLRGTAALPARPAKLELPAAARPLVPDDPRAEPFVRYLVDVRGYRPSEVRWLAQAYTLHWATRGPYAWRLIFPVCDRRGALLTWTARAIGSRTELRYKQPPDAEVRTPAPRTLLALDRLWGAPEPRVLVLCEGPLDAMRITVSGAPMGVWATCLFGLALTHEQCALVRELADRFPRVALLLDPGADHERLRMVRALAPLRVVLPRLPDGVEDPGALTAAQVAALCMDLLATLY